MLKLLHTADWHLGMSFGQFDEADRTKLTRARLEVVDKLLGLADMHQVHAVLCAGDLFDEPTPDPIWWKGLRKAFDRVANGWPASRPVFLLPGNHDPLTANSVWSPTHPFRAGLPPWVQVIDRPDFTAPLGELGVLHAVPCTSRAGQRDPTELIPARQPGDARIRVGMVHGQTFDLEGCQTNFPISKDAAAQRGLDYLAIGDTHGFRLVPPDTVPTVYPGAPEQTRFGETGAGQAALVFFRRAGQRPRVEPQRVATWTWREETCHDLPRLLQLRSENLTKTVLRLTLDMEVSLEEHEQVELILRELKGTAATHGRVGVLVTDRTKLALKVTGAEFPPGLPPVLKDVVARLREKEVLPEDAEKARRALIHLYRLVKDRC
mgnify:CR=1 FL=1